MNRGNIYGVPYSVGKVLRIRPDTNEAGEFRAFNKYKAWKTLKAELETLGFREFGCLGVYEV